MRIEKSSSDVFHLSCYDAVLFLENTRFKPLNTCQFLNNARSFNFKITLAMDLNLKSAASKLPPFTGRRFILVQVQWLVPL